MIKFTGTSALQAHPVNEFGAIIDGAAIANILGGGTESMVKVIGTSSLQFHPVDEQGNIIDATAIANEISGSLPSGKPTLPQNTIYVRTDGNNSNDGFSDSPSGAVQNIQGAIAVLKQYRGLPLVIISLGTSTAIAPIFWDDTAETLELGDNYNEIRISGQGIGSTYLEAGSGGFLFLDGSNTPQRLKIFLRNFSFTSGSASQITFNDHLFLEFQGVDFENTGVRFTADDFSRLDIQVSCNFAAHTYTSGFFVRLNSNSYLDLRDLLNNLTFDGSSTVFEILENSYGRTNIISATVNSSLYEVEEGSCLNSNGVIYTFDDTIANLGVTNFQEAIEAVKLIGKPLAPSTTITLDGSTGDDNNDGLTGAIATLPRLEEVLETYNWAGATVFANINNLTLSSNGSLSGTGITGIQSLFITGSAFIVDSAASFSLASFKQFLLVRLNNIELDTGEISVTDCSTVLLNSVSTRNHTGGTQRIIEANLVERLVVEVDQVEDVNCASVIYTYNTGSVELENDSGTFSNITVGGAFLTVLGDLSQEVRISVLSPAISVTGKAFAISAEHCSFTEFFPAASVTGTVTSTFSLTSIVNGKLNFTKGSFDDNAGALTGGLTTGDFYTTTGLGANPLNVAGIVMQVQ